MKYVFRGFFLLSIMMIGGVVQADTLVSEDIVDSVVWNLAGSPYVLEDHVVIKNGAQLIIDPGVNVVFNGYSLEVLGSLNVQGEKNNRVILKDTMDGSITAGSRTNIKILYADIKGVGVGGRDAEIVISHSLVDEGHTGIHVVDSKLLLDGVIIRNQRMVGIYSLRGSFSITNSLIENNGRGIHVQERDPVLSLNVLDFVQGITHRVREWFGVHNVFAQALAQYRVASSSVFNNSLRNIDNESSVTVDARNVWWGNIQGPLHDSPATIQGNVLYDPWLTTQPEIREQKGCCSSVLFLPGLQTSRLYAPGVLSENQLWEPNNDSDGIALYLDAEGKSVRSDVYTRDVIDRITIPAVVSISVYKSVLQAFSDLVQRGIVAAAKTIPYDWRFDPDTIIQKYQLIPEIEHLARDSFTGTVTIATHSYGGLVGKRLLQLLEQQGKGNLVDRIVYVAVPHYGTPKAITSLLYGDGQDIGKGFIFSKFVAQALAYNMPSAYMLLPSVGYFSPAIPHMIVGTSTSVRTWDRFKEFMKQANQFLFNRSELVHAGLDTWSSSSTRAWYLVGVGMPTVEGFGYTQKNRIFCLDRTCRNVTEIDRYPILSFDGDGTVMASSARALATTSQRLVFDIQSLNTKNGSNYAHANVLEFPEFITCLISIITKNSCTDSPPPVQGNSQTMQILSIHSPADITFTDSAGRIVNRYHASIPNSEYMEFGEGKYIITPQIPGTVYIVGTGVGTFTFAVERRVGTSSTVTTFTDIPVTPSTTASVVLDNSSIGVLSVDMNGDGRIDTTIRSGLSKKKTVALFLQTLIRERFSNSSLRDIVQQIITLLEKR